MLALRLPFGQIDLLCLLPRSVLAISHARIVRLDHLQDRLRLAWTYLDDGSPTQCWLTLVDGTPYLMPVQFHSIPHGISHTYCPGLPLSALDTTMRLLQADPFHDHDHEGITGCSTVRLWLNIKTALTACTQMLSKHVAVGSIILGYLDCCHTASCL